MSNFAKYILLGLTFLFTIIFLWYFSIIVSYIVAASVLTLVGRPLVKAMGRLKIGRFYIPVSIRALLTLSILWFLVISFFFVFIPIIASEANQLATIDVESFVDRIREPVRAVERYFSGFNLSQNEISFETYLEQKLSSLFKISALSDYFKSLEALLGNIFIAIFAISFITFFLLKEENLLTEMILIFVPEEYEERFKTMLISVKHLLSRYLIGIIIQLTGILLLVTIGMVIIGLSFKQSLLIGLVAALLNTIPYLGPLIGSSLGILLGIAFNIHLDIDAQLVLGLSMLLVFIIVQIIDNAVFQPFIFSKSVNAHPLEIFLVIMMAGSLAGIPGMILAIPVYTTIRVFAKVFFNNFRIVKKLTRKI